MPPAGGFDRGRASPPRARAPAPVPAPVPVAPSAQAVAHRHSVDIERGGGGVEGRRWGLGPPAGAGAGRGTQLESVTACKGQGQGQGPRPPRDRDRHGSSSSSSHDRPHSGGRRSCHHRPDDGTPASWNAVRHGERMFDRDDHLQRPSTAGGTAAATRAVGYILRHAVPVNAVDPEEVALRRRGCHRSAGPPLPAQSGAVLLLPAPQWGSRTRPRALPPQLPLVRPRKPVAAPPPWLSTQPGVPPPCPRRRGGESSCPRRMLPHPHPHPCGSCPRS
jgi:hypothetical protein